MMRSGWNFLAVLILLSCNSPTRSFLHSIFGPRNIKHISCDRHLHVVTVQKDLPSGRPHSAESKAKISAANKGKQPWNVGKVHSEETKRRIAEKTKEAMLKRKVEQAALLGMSLEEYSNRNKVTKEQKHSSHTSEKRGITEDGRRRISESLKKRWQDPAYRERILYSGAFNRSHSPETKARISEAIKLKWQDKEYRAKIITSPSEEVRARISATLKLKWENPEFRQRMMNMSFERTDEWRNAISIKIRAKWMDESYRNAVTSAIRDSFRGNKTLGSSGRFRRQKNTYSYEEKMEIEQKHEELKKMRREREKQKRDIIKAAKVAKKGHKKDASIKELLGGQLWFEEKLKRRKDGLGVLDDAKLEEQLLQEWTKEDFASEDKEIVDSDLDDFDILAADDENSEKILNKASDYISYADQDNEFSSDIIEVYDETGELVATYDAEEYAKLKGSASQ
jgi:hypothetical protein